MHAGFVRILKCFNCPQPAVTKSVSVHDLRDLQLTKIMGKLNFPHSIVLDRSYHCLLICLYPKSSESSKVFEFSNISMCENKINIVYPFRKVALVCYKEANTPNH
jgi:hypothetical protein